MSVYTYICDVVDKGCGYIFEISCAINEYDSQPHCPKCSRKLAVRRDYQSDEPLYVGDSTPKTLGSVCDRNSAKLSNDEKHHLHKKHNEYKNIEPSRQLPDGMTRLRKGSDE